MDQQIISLFAEHKFSDLEQLLKRMSQSEFTVLIEKQGKGDPAALIRSIFSGSPQTTTDGVQRRLCVTKNVISVFQNTELGSKVTAEITGLLLSEMDAFPSACLVDLADYYIEGIKNGTWTSSKCLELFPKVLSAIEARPAVKVGDHDMKGAEYKSHILNSLCSCRWPSDVILHIVAMLRDVVLSADELGHVIAKTLRHFVDVQHHELPPLIYQLLLLSTKGHKKMVLDGVIAHFVAQDSKQSAASNRQSSVEDGLFDDLSGDQLHHTEGTVILHITLAVKQDQQLGREFIKYFKTNQQFSLYKVLSPFTSALALSIGRIHSFEEQIFELLKSAIIKSYRDAERQRLSHWVADLVSDQRFAAAEQILDTIKNSIVGWDHITQGLVQLGFALMESFGMRTAFGRLGSPPSNVKPILLTPAQAACGLGVRILQETFRVHESARSEIVDRLLNSIVTKASSPVTHYLELLSSTVKTSPRVLLECLPRLREAFDYFMFLPIATAEGFLLAIQPLLKLSTALQDSLVLVLRKAVFSRQIDARRVAVSGFLMLLNNFRVLSNGLSLSQQSSQSLYSANSQVQVDVHLNSSQMVNEALCLEILSTLRRSLTQQADIRLVLYEGLFNILQANVQLANPVIGLLSDQFQRYFEVQSDVNPPVKLDACIILQGDEPYVAEPLGHLLGSLCSCIVFVQKRSSQPDGDAFDKENNDVLFNSVKMLDSLIQRMIKCESEDFELDKSADFSCLTSVGVRNTIVALLVSGLYEVLMEYRFFSSNFESEHVQQVLDLYQNFHCINDMMKDKLSNSAAVGAAGKKKARSGKESVSDAANACKPGYGIASIGFLSSVLSAIYSDELPEHQAGIALLRSNVDIQRHLVSSAVARLQQVNQLGRCDGIDGANTDKLIKHCCKIGRVLLQQYSSASTHHVSSSLHPTNNNQPIVNESAKQRALMSLCLDGFASATALFCTRFSHQLLQYLKVIDKSNVAARTGCDKTREQELIHKLIQRLQRMTVGVLNAASGGEDRPVHDAVALLGALKHLSQLLDSDSTALSDLESWLHRLCKEQTIDDQAVVKSLLQQLLVVARRRGSAVELCRDFARDVHCCLGDIDQEVEVDANNRTFAIVSVRSAMSCAFLVIGHLETEIDDLEWIVSRMKAEMADGCNLPTESTQRDSVEKSVCTRLGHVINAFHEFLQAALPIGPCIDAVLRAINRLYIVLTLFAKLSLSMYVQKLGHMASRFEKLVKLSAVNLTPFVYTVITYVQNSQGELLQAEADKAKKKKKNSKVVSTSDKTRALKETKSIPNLIYSVEQYEKYLIQLSKKSKVDLTAHLKMSTSRDFRINAASLQAVMEREEEQSDGNEDNENVDDRCSNASAVNSCDESDNEASNGPSAKKAKASSPPQPAAVTSRKKRLGKQ